MVPQSLPMALRYLRQVEFPRKYGILDRLFGASLERAGITPVETAGGMVWRLDLRNPTHRWCVYGSVFGPGTSRWIRNWLRDGGIVIDSGANIGQAIIDFAQYPGVTVYAFEPLPECQEWIRQSLEFNDGLDVTVVPLGLYKENARLEIQIAGGPEIHGAHSTLRMDWYREKHFSRISIEVVPVDDFVANRGIDRIRFWKLDVEGAELEALQGAQRMLAQHRVDALLVEVSAGEPGVMDYMSSCAYLPYSVSGRGALRQWRASDPAATDCIFLPRP